MSNNYPVWLLSQQHQVRSERARTDKSAMHVARTTANATRGMATMNSGVWSEVVVRRVRSVTGARDWPTPRLRRQPRPAACAFQNCIVTLCSRDDHDHGFVRSGQLWQVALSLWLGAMHAVSQTWWLSRTIIVLGPARWHPISQLHWVCRTICYSQLNGEKIIGMDPW